MFPINIHHLVIIIALSVSLVPQNLVNTSAISSLLPNRKSSMQENFSFSRENHDYFVNSFRSTSSSSVDNYYHGAFSEIQSDSQVRTDNNNKKKKKSNHNKKGGGGGPKKSKSRKGNRSHRNGGGRGGRKGRDDVNEKAGRGQRQKASSKNALRLLSRDADNIEGVGAFPPLFNIASRALARVNATCGRNGHEEYCKLVDSLPEKTWQTQCGICDDHSIDVNKRHPIEAILNNSSAWWQSPTLEYGSENEYVTITLDLRQPHQVFFIMLKAAISPRPASWILERSVDNITYQPWQYFGLSDIDCRRRYGIPGQNGKYVFQSDTEVICTTQFSRQSPLENGEIHISLLKNRPGLKDQSQELLDFITARFIRFRFQGMHSTANSDNSVGWQLDAESLRKRSFYSLRTVRVSGRLHCHGHARKTIEVEDENDEMMHHCVCLHNTCGVYCDQCCPLYNDQLFRQGTLTADNMCQRCECHGHATKCIYDQSISASGGVCQNCTHFTTGRNCEKCTTGYYRPQNVSINSEEPCIKCDCNTKGSDNGCDPVTGVCTCKEGFTGPQCDECLPGFKGPSCERCSCDVRGTLPGSECDDPCQCKLYAEDENCSSCVPGYFALRTDHPDGCLKCYCSGVAVTCRSYDSEITSFETLDAWRVTDIANSVIAYPSIDNDTGNLVFGMYELPEVEAVYWLSPKGYGGNRLESYGSKLVVKIEWVVIRGDTSGKPTSGPNVILIGRNGAKIAYADQEFQGSSATIEVPLTEKGWYHVPSSVKDIITRQRRTEYRGDPVTRVQFMSVLTDVESVMIRGTYHTDQGESILERATLYSGASETMENEWSLVEECQCPPGYAGLSCESCTFGYVRVYENSTSHEVIGKCIPCGCNGHAESCDLENDECGECIHNTFGERCERCKMGYYGNAMHGTPLDCKRCACPLLEDSNNFSPSCQLKRLSLDTNQYEFDSDEDYVCTQCPDGYIGDHCEQCDDGYYGDPLVIGSKCLPCPCNGGPCHSITGECITCLGNTEGWRCERCQTGFWGDPNIACEPCNCNYDGSTGNLCNPETGQCTCHDHFIGKKCNECALGFAKSTSSKFDCVPCQCNVNGSLSSFCESVSGQCECKFGVEGLTCGECREEFYGLTATGCEECRCNSVGSKYQACNRINGQCDCLPNVTGQRCNMCQFGFWNLTANAGCQKCECHPLGAQDNICDSVTGRCICKQGVGGYRCDRCLEGFYGLSKDGCKICDRCPSSGHLCDSVTGGCICPANTKGPDCQHCQTNAWNWQPRIGCEPCDCDHVGSIGQSCDARSGQCTCKEGYTGHRCDSCAAGYFDYPLCKRCNCNVHGSKALGDGLIPCDYLGQCPCKSLVTGLKCDICRQHTFGLHKSNPDGCTRCFCFQRSQQCTQSDLSWGLIRMQGARNLSVEYIRPEFVPEDEYEYVVLVQMEGSTAYEEDAEIQSMNSLSLIPSSTGNVSIGAYTAFYYPLYFQLPPQFHGDRIKSYGGFLRFSILTGGARSPMDPQILQHFPLVQIHSCSKLILDYYQEESRNISLNESFVVPLHESHWRLHSNDQNVTRAVLMAALQNIKHIFLRGTTWMDFTEVVLHGVRMDTAIYLAGSTTSLAYGVEQCLCPDRFDGLSCQDPGRGHYRVRNCSSNSLEDVAGRAVPCHCHGRSDECDRETGVCFNCRRNSGGDHCERCADGHYGDPNIGECKPCPCPETSRNYAKGCAVSNGEVRCQCKPGYTGALCDMCAKSYYGLPSEPGGQCKPCNCNPDGIVSYECDEENGQCNCRPGVTGRKCDRCSTARYILEDRRCKLCDNCTLTLLDTVENIGNQLRRGLAHINLTHINAPYSKVNDFEKRVNQLNSRLHDLIAVKDALEEYDGNSIDKLLYKSEELKIQSRKNKDFIEKQQGKATDILDRSAVELDDAQRLSNDVSITISDLNSYGSNHQHMNIDGALAEAIPILQQLKNHQSNRENYENHWICARDQYNYFATTSDILQDQLVDIENLSLEINQFNHRISDMIMKTTKTFDTLNEADDVLEHIRNFKNKLVEENGRIEELEDELLKKLNNSFVADGNLKTGMIENGLNEIFATFYNTISNLSDMISDKLNKTDDQLRNIRMHWIPKAGKYATVLTNKAKEYADKFQTTKDGAQVALLASTAHQNISNAIHAAKEAAKEAQQSAKLAQDKLYTADGGSMMERGQKSLEESRQLNQVAMGKMEKIANLKNALKSHEINVDGIKSTIHQSALKNNGISLALEKLNKTDQMNQIQQTSEKAEKISKDMLNELAKTAALDKDINKLRDKFATLEPDWETKLGMAEENVTEIQSKLQKAKSSLIKVENETKRSSQEFQKANATLSRSLQELRDKIAKAKHTAEGVKVSLDSVGNRCSRSYTPPFYGLSTSNTMKVTLSLAKDAEESPLVFIQGNHSEFIAIEMIQKQIRLVWNLGGRTGSVIHPMKIISLDSKLDEAWYQVDVNRTLNIGSLLVRRMTNSSTLREESPAVSTATNSEDTRFLITPSDYIWIGGIPDSLRPKELTTKPGLNVILHQVEIDEQPIGLWNFASDVKDECSGAIAGPIEANPTMNARFFNGEGYAELKRSRRPYRKNRFSLQMAFKTFDENALLFLAVDNDNNRSISITLSNGRIVFRIDYGQESKLEIVTSKKYNTGKEIRLEAAREFVPRGMTENGSLKVNGEDSLNGSPTAPIKSALLPDLSKASFYLGGVPPGFRSGITKAPGADNPFMGCMMDVQINGESYDPLEGVTYFGVEQSCKTAIKKAGFYGKGFIELSSQSLYRRANAGFVFRTLQPECLLVLSAYPPSIEENYDDLKGNYSISLVEGRVQVWLQTGRDQLQVGSKMTVNDGEYHVLNLIKNGRKIELMIDDEKQWTRNLTGKISMPDDEGGLYFGGAPDFENLKTLTPTFIPFEGSIKDVVFNNKTLLFSDAIDFKNVEIGRNGPEMGMYTESGGVLMKTEPIGRSFAATSEGCQRVGSYSYEPNAFKFGDGPFSHSQLNVTVRNFWQKNFLIKFDFRTFYPNGVVFIAPGTKEKQKHFVALLLKDGQLMLRVRGRKKVDVLLSAKLNDGQWHQVMISCQERKVTMSVEIGDTGQRTSTQMKIPKKVSASNNMFVGGIPESGVVLPIEVEPFKGCIRKLSINNSTKDLARPGKHLNVGQCFPNIEKGSYFPGDAYATYKKNFHVGKYLELELDFRTSELNGVLLSVSEPNGFPALSLELHNGNIVFSVDMGDGNPFRVESHFPSKYTLCDNKWHNISTLYDAEQIALSIDKHPTIISMAQNRVVNKVHTKSPLYIGGLPDIAPSGTLLSRENFKGCIRNVSIRGERRDWIDMDSLHNVLLSECLAVN